MACIKVMMMMMMMMIIIIIIIIIMKWAFFIATFIRISYITKNIRCSPVLCYLVIYLFQTEVNTTYQINQVSLYSTQVNTIGASQWNFYKPRVFVFRVFFGKGRRVASISKTKHGRKLEMQFRDAIVLLSEPITCQWCCNAVHSLLNLQQLAECSNCTATA